MFGLVQTARGGAGGGSSRSPGRRRGFTLIELLIVIGIVAVLLSMLLPTLGRARAFARRTVCGTNLRIIGQGWMMYLPDNNETFPYLYKNMQWFYGGKGVDIWSHPIWTLDHRPLNPYVAMALRGEFHAEIFRCAADGVILGLNGRSSPTMGATTHEYFGNSYMMNYTLLRTLDPETLLWLYKPVRLFDVKLPHSRVVLAGDCQWYYSMLDAPYDAQFHNREHKVNLLFLDGHVAFTQIVKGKSAWVDYSFWPFPVAWGEDDDDGDAEEP